MTVDITMHQLAGHRRSGRAVRGREHIIVSLYWSTRRMETREGTRTNVLLQRASMCLPRVTPRCPAVVDTHVPKIATGENVDIRAGSARVRPRSCGPFVGSEYIPYEACGSNTRTGIVHQIPHRPGLASIYRDEVDTRPAQRLDDIPTHRVRRRVEIARDPGSMGQAVLVLATKTVRCTVIALGAF